MRADLLVHQVYDVIKKQILTGTLHPGDRLVESRIAKQFGVSRSPIREAFRMLVSEGLVINEHGVTRIIEPSMEDFKQLYELRVALESMAAKLAAERITDENRDLLGQIIEQTAHFVEQQQIDQVIEINVRFHDLIVLSSSNQRIIKAIHEVSTLIRYYRMIVFRVYQRRDNFLLEHREIYEAIKAGDALQAEQSMYKHIMRDLVFIETAFKK